MSAVTLIALGVFITIFVVFLIFLVVLVVCIRRMAAGSVPLPSFEYPCTELFSPCELCFPLLDSLFPQPLGAIEKCVLARDANVFVIARTYIPASRSRSEYAHRRRQEK